MPQASFHNQSSRSPSHRMSTDDAADTHPHTHAHTNSDTTSYYHSDRQQSRSHSSSYPAAQPSELLASPTHKRPSYSEQHHDYSHREHSYQGYPSTPFHADAHHVTYERPSLSPTDSPMNYYGHEQQQQHAHDPSRRTPRELGSMMNNTRRFSQEDENAMYSVPRFHAGPGHHPENTSSTMISNSGQVGGGSGSGSGSMISSPSTTRTAAPGLSPLSPQSPPTAAQGAQTAAAGTYLAQSPHSRSPQTPPQTPSPRKYARSNQQPPRHYHYHPHHHPQQQLPHTPQQASRQQASPLVAATASHSKHGSTVGPNRRMAHILSEQKRREKINGGFDELKSVIPESVSSPQLS
ncbi:unnamed protein product [Mortierella alpina]